MKYKEDSFINWQRGEGYMNLNEIITQINIKLNEIKDKKHILVWGAAENTVRLLQYTDISLYSIEDYVDNQKAGEQFFGKTVQAPQDISWKNVDAVVISSFYHEYDIEKELNDKYGFAGTVVRLNEAEQKVPFYMHLRKEELQAPESLQYLLNRNSKFKNIHEGKRLFILCCGPSINQMDLTILKDEITMAVSSFYLHKDIKIIQPNYYCDAAWSLDTNMTKSLGLEYIKEVKKYVGNSVYFFSALDKETIDESHAFDSDEIYYYYNYSGEKNLLYEDIDICQKIMSVRSVPILCLQLALYMGFKEIYLVGAEHDTLSGMQYKHFYNYNESIVDKTIKVTDEQGYLNTSYSTELSSAYRLWEQYKVIKKIAEKKGANIYNATLGGVLDVFDRVDFNKLFN